MVVLSDMKPRIPLEEFVKLWQTADSLERVSELTGQPTTVVYTRAWNLRQKGVHLKKFPKKHRIRVEKLNKLIDEIHAEGLDE